VRVLRAGLGSLLLCAGLLLISAPLVAGAESPAAALAELAPPAPIDLLAFYCALRRCEHDAFTATTGHTSRYANLVVPAPLPPYALLFLEPLGELPFGTARAVLYAAALGASLFLAFALFALARTYLVVFLVGVLISVAVPALELGQIVPLAVAALAGSAWALRSGLVPLASALAAFTLIEPHLGLPAVLALFACVPAARRWLLLCGGVLGIATLAGGGYGGNLEYFMSVLPAHARAEGTSFGGQYSLAAVLAQLGVSEPVALAAGTASYVLMLLLGIAVARSIYRRTGDPAFAIATAPAFTLLGGAFVHIHQMAAALPLAAVLLGSSERRLAPALALLGLLIPWDLLEKMGVTGAWFQAIPPHDAHAALASVAGGDRLAEDIWGAWVRSDSDGNRPALELWLFKLPTWLSLATLCVLSWRRTRYDGFSLPAPLRSSAISSSSGSPSTSVRPTSRIV